MREYGVDVRVLIAIANPGLRAFVQGLLKTAKAEVLGTFATVDQQEALVCIMDHPGLTHCITDCSMVPSSLTGFNLSPTTTYAVEGCLVRVYDKVRR